MKDAHLTSIQVNNFKRFDSLEVDNIGQFNLIFGDNNVGKTSLLEALLLNNNLETLSENLLTALNYRNLGRLSIKYESLKYYFRNLEEEKSNVTFKFHYKNEQNEEYQLSMDPSNVNLNCIIPLISPLTSPSEKEQRVLLSKEFHGAGSGSIPFVPFYVGHGFDLVALYSNHIQKYRDRKMRLIKALNTMAPGLDNIEISLSAGQPILVISQKNTNAVLPLAVLGDGALKLFRFFIEIVVNANKRLMIDEIDTGIHYSRFGEFWRILLSTAKDNNVQLFMTTHNRECISYFDEAVKELKMDKESRGITLIQSSKDYSVKAFTYNFNELNHAMKVGNEIRGGY